MKRIPLPADIADIFIEGYSAQEEFGYWGPDSRKLVAWAAENARGRLHFSRVLGGTSTSAHINGHVETAEVSREEECWPMDGNSWMVYCR